MIFLDFIYELISLFPNACALIIRSIFAVHPKSVVTKQLGESTILLLTFTFSILSPRISFILEHNTSNSSESSDSNSRFSLVTDTNFLSSKSLICCIIYSSNGSIIKRTSFSFLIIFSIKGEFSTLSLVSPVI